MNCILLSLVLIFSTNNEKSAFDSKVRILYNNSVSNVESCKELLNLLKDYHENNNCKYAGYKACATILMAKHVGNPFKKYYYFKEGKKLLEKCIDNEIDNAELRYLRFTIQTNAPTFLGYCSEIQSDKVFLMESINKIKDSDLRHLIISTLKRSKVLNSNEMQLLKSIE